MDAGHSGTPLATKLGVQVGHRLALVHAPEGWTVADLPERVTVRRTKPTATAKVDIAIAFFWDLASLEGSVGDLAQRITPDGSLWLAWPRRAGGHESDITDNEIRRVALPLGIVDVKVAALDGDWSGLKMVWRKELRAGLNGGPTAKVIDRGVART